MLSNLTVPQTIMDYYLINGINDRFRKRSTITNTRHTTVSNYTKPTMKYNEIKSPQTHAHIHTIFKHLTY